MSEQAGRQASMTTTVLDLETKKLLKEVAESQDYKMSGYIRHLIKDDLRRRGYTVPGDEEDWVEDC